MQKLRLNIGNLFATNNGLLLGATATFDIEVLDESGNVMGRASVDLRGKVGPNSLYIKEYDLTREKSCVT